jgi:hypothetical protein
LLVRPLIAVLLIFAPSCSQYGPLLLDIAANITDEEASPPTSIVTGEGSWFSGPAGPAGYQTFSLHRGPDPGGLTYDF